MNIITDSEKKTIALGQKYGRESRGGEVFLLIGDLGGGKTQFTKGLAKGLGIDENITSPTFNYENIYKTAKGKNLYHFDLYRSEKVDEDIKALLLEAFSDKDGVTVVEWAERARDFWPKGATLIKFEWVTENQRSITINSNLKS